MLADFESIRIRPPSLAEMRCQDETICAFFQDLRPAHPGLLHRPRGLFPPTRDHNSDNKAKHGSDSNDTGHNTANHYGDGQTDNDAQRDHHGARLARFFPAA